MHLHIVRHGQTDWNAQRRIQGQLDSELDETGRQQARDRGADFVDMPLTAVYSSSSLRTRQTTELILGSRTDRVTFRDDLREVRLGIWQGRFWADIEKEFPELVDAHAKASPFFEVEGAEKSSEVQKRGCDAIESIISAHRNSTEDENILIVSHGAIMKTILAYYHDIPLSDLHHLPSLPNCAHCVIEAAGNSRKISSIASTAIEDTPWHSAAKST